MTKQQLRSTFLAAALALGAALAAFLNRASGLNLSAILALLWWMKGDLDDVVEQALDQGDARPLSTRSECYRAGV